jgi:hypothetical protein
VPSATDLDLALALTVVVPGPILPTDIRHPSDARHNMVILVRAFVHGSSPFTIMCIHTYIDMDALTSILCIPSLIVGDTAADVSPGIKITVFVLPPSPPPCSASSRALLNPGA